MTATGTAVGAHLRDLVRRRTMTAMMLMLPPTVIVTYGAAMDSFPDLAALPGDPATAGRVIGAVFATAFLAGLVGLFQAIDARGTDDRLTVAGFPRSAIVGSRVITTVVVATVAAVVALIVVAFGTPVTAPIGGALALIGAGLVYGLIGALVGQVLPRDLEGSLVLVFLADADTALSSGLFDIENNIASWFPLSHPIDAFQTAVYDGAIATGDLVVTAAYATLVAALLAVVTLLGGENA